MARRLAASAVRGLVALAACGALIAADRPRAAFATSAPAHAATTSAGAAIATTSGNAATATTPASAAAPTPRSAAPAPPPLAVRAAALIDEGTGQQLYGRDANAELAIASTTKLMTALITLRHVPLSRVFAYPVYYLPSIDSQIGLVPGERMNVHDLLVAMLLPSADDAAYDLAFNVGHGSVSRFLGMMNTTAGRLGLRHTHYTTPSGLDTPGNYSSAGDLVTLARYLLLHERFFKSAVAQSHAVLRTGGHVRAVTNLNDLVARVPWINGVKTGHTLDAGYVLIAAGTQHGMTLIDAVLGTSSESARDANALALLDWGFANFGLRTPVRAGTVLARPAITGKPKAFARLIAASTYTHVFPRSATVRLKVTAPASLTGPLPANTAAGSVAVVENDRVVARIPLRLAGAVPQIRKKDSGLGAVVVSVTLSVLVVAAGAAIGLTMFWREWTRGTRGRRPTPR